MEDALGDACMHCVHGWVVSKLGPGSNVGTVVLLARDDAALLLDGNLLDYTAQAGGWHGQNFSFNPFF